MILTYVAQNPKFYSISLYEPFSSYSPFWDKRTEGLKNNLEY